MQIEKDAQDDCSGDDEHASQPAQPAYARERSAEATIAVGNLIAMAAQAFAHDVDRFAFALRVQFIANIAPASLAAILVDVVRRARDRPLVRVDVRATHVTRLCLRQSHLLFGAGRMLLLGEVILAEALVAIRATPQRFLVAFVAAPRRWHTLMLHS